jgi:hypothetical protein
MLRKLCAGKDETDFGPDGIYNMTPDMRFWYKSWIAYVRLGLF